LSTHSVSPLPSSNNAAILTSEIDTPISVRIISVELKYHSLSFCRLLGLQELENVVEDDFGFSLFHAQERI
jgi:hypothetical protein